MKFEIAIELLEEEHRRLLNDHYDTLPTPEQLKFSEYQRCDGCARAYAIKRELDTLKKEVPQA